MKHFTSMLQRFYAESARIEAAFRKYFHRASPKQKEDSYELIVSFRMQLALTNKLSGLPR